jgi:large subunit ribosomal protein L31
MKKNLHPETHEVTAHCACGYSFTTSSTKNEINTSICSHCHPFYTGAQKFLDTAGRIEKFEQRYKKFQEGTKKAAEAPAKKKAAAPKAKAKAK